MTERFETLVEGHLDALHRFAVSLTRDRDVARDLLHDTFVKGFEGYHAFRPGTHFRAWIFAILVNTFRTRVRDTGRHPHVALDESNEPASDGDVVFELLEGTEILDAVEALPEPYRSTVLLVDREEMRYAEVAVVMDCPLGTVMSRLHRGRGLLRRRLLGLARERGFQTAGKRVGEEA
ncbi:MAG TPA: RNA polymerase sigma factor [Fibrobacteria bacterium]|nr:RNA polymerase sigma factor [Fibrobacteria bacterium]